MAHRVFVDDAGTKWEVWEVFPMRAERRVRQRRLAQEKVEGDRRREPDRRARKEHRTSLGPELTHGWLAFDSGKEKRRYAPVPAGWTELSARELQELCRRATVVRHSSDEDLPREVTPPKPGIAALKPEAATNGPPESQNGDENARPGAS